MERTLAKHFPELCRSNRRELFGAFLLSIPLLGGLCDNRNLLRGHSVLAPGVIGQLHIDFSQRDNVAAADDTDVLSLGRGGKPATQILLRIRNRESLHIDFIALVDNSGNH